MSLNDMVICAILIWMAFVIFWACEFWHDINAADDDETTIDEHEDGV